jgi:hypothetical protein
LREGNQTESLPSYLKSRFFIDFRNDEDYQIKFEELLRHIFNEPKYSRPQLGLKPFFKDETMIKKINKKDNENQIIKQKEKELNLVTFKKVYDFAYSPNGMNKDRTDAQKFAEIWVSDKRFDKFKEVYLFAYSISDMNKDRIDAQNFAEIWVENYFDKDFNEFKEVYLFAYSISGMNKNRIDAQKFALKTISKE